MDEDISNFSAITNADPQVARGFIEMSGGDLQAAIQLYFENPDLQNSFGAAGASAVPPSVPSSTRPAQSGGEDQPIQIDSDDDADMLNEDFGQDDDDDDDRGTTGAARVARTAQEEEDAAMAKRLQEELYGSGGPSGGGADPDSVRSPIRATQETLVAPTMGGFHDDDGGADVSAMLQQQMRARRAARGGGPRNPFNHDPSIWDDDSGPARSGGASSQANERSRRLADLYRPPFDLISDLDWEDARAEGKEEKKWILVNFQDNSVFQCQMLNRDIWKDEAVTSLVKESFIFLQYTANSLDAQPFMQFYFPSNSHENPDNFPHVSIIDPRTGEQVKVWSGAPFPTASEFHAQLAEFLDRYSLDASKKNPVVQETTKRPKTVDVDRMTEEEMLEMALQNSMATANNNNSAGGSSGEGSQAGKAGVPDPDALTKASSTAEPAQPPSAFASIPSDQPHAEPEHNPATTTRIQFRHSGGRVIRRFELQDHVRRIYEWLKAEPLEGKEGVEFELKQMPQGQDLISELDKTIVEAGLKQGTVMIELLED